MEYLRNDTGMQQLRKEWKEKFTEPFPGWNYDYYKSPKNISKILIQCVAHRTFIYGGSEYAGMGV